MAGGELSPGGTKGMIRRQFVAITLGAAAVAAQQKAVGRPDKGPPLALDMVKEFVSAAHGNFERTRTVLDEQPALVNAVWDWGGGDFETALGGAGHMGNREIALYLLGKGARMELFAAAMLGKLDVVKAALTAFPILINTPGPHGIPLIAHARKGGADAADVLSYIESLSVK